MHGRSNPFLSFSNEFSPLKRPQSPGLAVAQEVSRPSVCHMPRALPCVLCVRGSGGGPWGAPFTWKVPRWHEFWIPKHPELFLGRQFLGNHFIGRLDSEMFGYFFFRPLVGKLRFCGWIHDQLLHDSGRGAFISRQPLR